MMAMPIAIRSRKSCHQHVWTKGSNHPHHIAEGHVMPMPLVKRFFGGLRISKVSHTREPLLDSVISVRRQQLQSAQHAQCVEKITAGLVLSTLAAVQRS